MSELRQATLGGGCFWCLDAVYQITKGVSSVQSGFAGGETPNPTYRQVVTGTTGHAEVVQLEFDPEVISYRTLLEIFFTVHDPTTLNRQGADRGTQYRSIVLTHDEEQARVAREVMEEFEASGAWKDPIVTQVKELDTFWPAESYHDDFYRKNPGQPYCRVVIDPKISKFRSRFAPYLEPANP